MTRTVVVEIKYFCTKNVVIQTENCKLNLPLDCSTIQMDKNIRRTCGIDESSRRRGFADFALEVFYIDFIQNIFVNPCEFLCLCWVVFRSRNFADATRKKVACGI